MAPYRDRCKGGCAGKSERGQRNVPVQTISLQSAKNAWERMLVDRDRLTFKELRIAASVEVGVVVVVRYSRPPDGR